MMLSGTPSRASSSACAWRSWSGAKLRLTPARAATRRNSLRTLAADQARRRVRPSMMQKQRPHGQLSAGGEPGAQLFPAPVVHADLAPSRALAAADQQRPTPLIEVVLRECERPLEPRSGPPEDDDQCAQAPAVTVVGRVTHDRHDLVRGRRIRRVAHALVGRRAAGVVAGRRHRRATPPGSV
jgi:hypothetical protein